MVPNPSYNVFRAKLRLHIVSEHSTLLLLTGWVVHELDVRWFCFFFSRFSVLAFYSFFLFRPLFWLCLWTWKVGRGNSFWKVGFISILMQLSRVVVQCIPALFCWMKKFYLPKKIILFSIRLMYSIYFWTTIHLSLINFILLLIYKLKHSNVKYYLIRFKVKFIIINLL